MVAIAGLCVLIKEAYSHGSLDMGFNRATALGGYIKRIEPNDAGPYKGSQAHASLSQALFVRACDHKTAEQEKEVHCEESAGKPFSTANYPTYMIKNDEQGRYTARAIERLKMVCPVFFHEKYYF